MLRENLKAAIDSSGMIVKEIASKSGVKKRTIDKWVGASATEPRVNDLYKVCKVLGQTMEWVVAGEGTPSEISIISRKIADLPFRDREEIMLLVDHKLKKT